MEYIFQVYKTKHFENINIHRNRVNTIDLTKLGDHDEWIIVYTELWFIE